MGQNCLAMFQALVSTMASWMSFRLATSRTYLIPRRFHGFAERIPLWYCQVNVILVLLDARNACPATSNQ